MEYKIRELVSQLDIATLRELVLKHCGQDSAFRLEVLSHVENPENEELAAIKKMIKASIQKNRGYDYWDEDDCDAVCGDMEKALDTACSRMEQGQYPQALDILQYIAITCIELPDEFGDESGFLSDTMGRTMGLLHECVEEMSKNADAEERHRLLRRLLSAIEGTETDSEWGSYRYELLLAAAPLADKQSAEEIYALLEQWEEPSYTYLLEQNRKTRYNIIAAVEGPEAARAYLDQNLDMDKLRLIAVQEDIEKGNYANAEQLCLGKTENGAEKAYSYRPSQWNYLLYEIYKKWGHKEERWLQARRLVLMGDWSYYQIFKDAMLSSGRWEEEYPKLRDEMRAVRMADEYMRLLKDEGETELLMEQVRLHKNKVFQYGAAVAPQYGGEVYALCAEDIREGAKPVTNREQYQNLCGKIQLLDSFGGRKEALELIEELAQKYPRRRAMLEELKKTREKLEKI